MSQWAAGQHYFDPTLVRYIHVSLLPHKHLNSKRFRRLDEIFGHISLATLVFIEMKVKPNQIAFKLVFHLANLFARTSKSECDWLVMSSVFVASHQVAFFSVRANKFA